MKLEALLQKIDPQWHGAFLNFIETGEADSQFLAQMDSDPALQKVIDEAFAAQAQAFENLASALRQEDKGPSEPLETKAAGLAMAAALEDVLDLPAEHREEAVRSAVATVKSQKPDRAETLVKIAQTLRTA